MGIDFQRVILPARRLLAPETATVARLVEAIRAGGWLSTREGLLHVYGPSRADSTRPLPDPVTAEWLAAFRNPTHQDPLRDELWIGFSVDATTDEPPRPALITPGEPPAGYDVRVYVSRDPVYHFANTVDDGPTPPCACGAELEYDRTAGTRMPPIGATHFRSTCAACGAPFDPQGVVASVFSHHTALGWGYAPTAVQMPMLASRFALVVDFEKDWPREVPRAPTFDPALRELCEGIFGERFDDVALFI